MGHFRGKGMGFQLSLWLWLAVSLVFTGSLFVLIRGFRQLLRQPSSCRVVRFGMAWLPLVMAFHGGFLLVLWLLRGGNWLLFTFLVYLLSLPLVFMSLQSAWQKFLLPRDFFAVVWRQVIQKRV